jgi:hypothetical protein
MADQYIPCFIKRLPDHLQYRAALDAIRINPRNADPVKGLAKSGIMIEPQRIAVAASKFFPDHKVDLKVGFLEKTSPALAEKILLYANKWGATGQCNVRFTLEPNPRNAQIRITFRQEGYWSFLGLDCLAIRYPEPTMCLQDWSLDTSESEYDRVVCHEFGHGGLGCVHEHPRKGIIDRLDPVKVYEWARRTQGWSKEETDAQILTPTPEEVLIASPVDEDSCMCYWFSGDLTKDGKPVRGGKGIVAADYRLVQTIYPAAVQPPVPPPPPPPSTGALFHLTFARQVPKGGRVAFSTPVAIPPGHYGVVPDASGHAVTAVPVT